MNKAAGTLSKKIAVLKDEIRSQFKCPMAIAIGNLIKYGQKGIIEVYTGTAKKLKPEEKAFYEDIRLIAHESDDEMLKLLLKDCKPATSTASTVKAASTSQSEN